MRNVLWFFSDLLQVLTCSSALVQRWKQQDLLTGPQEGGWKHQGRVRAGQSPRIDTAESHLAQSTEPGVVLLPSSLLLSTVLCNNAG